MAATTEGDQAILVSFRTSRSLLGDTTAVERKAAVIPATEGGVTHLALSVKQRDLVLASAEGFLLYYDITNTPHLIDRVNAVPNGARITALEYLSGGSSVLTGDSRGRITQWFPLRAQDNRYTLARVRDFRDQTRPITEIAPEYFRKGFVATDESGSIGLYHTTAHRTLLVTQATGEALSHVAMSPRADALMTLDGGQALRVYTVHNEHPEVSWSSLWGKVWYESRQQPEFIWQSSSAASDFEPKFSLTPLASGLSRRRSTRCCSRSPSRSWARCIPATSCLPQCARSSNRPSRSWAPFPPWFWDFSPACGWRRWSSRIFPASLPRY